MKRMIFKRIEIFADEGVNTSTLRFPKNGQEVEIYFDMVHKGKDFFLISGFEFDLLGEKQAFTIDWFREPNFTNELTKELAFKQLWEDENWREKIAVPERIFTTKADF